MKNKKTKFGKEKKLNEKNNRKIFQIRKQKSKKKI